MITVLALMEISMVASPTALASTVMCRNRETMKHKVNTETSRCNFR